MGVRSIIACLVVQVLCCTAGMSFAATVDAVRIGVHADYTRVVFDTGISTRPTISQIDDDRLSVRFDLGRADDLRVEPAHGLLRRIGVDSDRGSTSFDLVLKSAGGVRKAFALAPKPGSENHRFVIDLAKTAAPSGTKPVAATTPAPPAAAPQPPTEVPVLEEGSTALDPTLPDTDGLDPAAEGRGDEVGAGTQLALVQPRRRPKPGEPELAPVEPDPFVVVVDPGHGGKDPGAIGQTLVQEKALTLAIGVRVAEVLATQDSVEVHLTRSRDVGVRLAQRMTKAVEVDADLFISLHADSIPDQPQISGASVYTLSAQPSDVDAARKAQEENAADDRLQIITEHQDETVRTILTSLMRTSTTNRSADFAALLVDELRGVTPLINRNRRFANFVVLRSLRVPSVLVELGYLSNAADEAALLEPDHQDRLAHAIARAVLRLVETEGNAVPRR